MPEGLFALAGAALGFVGAIVVERMRQRDDSTADARAFQRSTLIELQDVTDRFLTGMADVHRATHARKAPAAFDIETAQDANRELLRRIRILASRVKDRRVEALVAGVFESAYGAQASGKPLEPAYKLWATFNDYVGTLLR